MIPQASQVGETFTIDDVLGLPVYYHGEGPALEYHTDIGGHLGMVNNIDSLTLTVVPEPATLLFFGFGVLLLKKK